MVRSLFVRIIIDGVVACCVLLHSVCSLEATQMNMQLILIREFKLDHYAAEAAKNFCYAKNEGVKILGVLQDEILP